MYKDRNEAELCFINVSAIAVFFIWNFLATIAISEDNALDIGAFLGAIVLVASAVYKLNWKCVVYGFLMITPLGIQPQLNYPHSHIPALINCIHLILIGVCIASIKIKNIWGVVFRSLVWFYIPMCGLGFGLYYLITKFPAEELIIVDLHYTVNSNPNFFKTFQYMEIFVLCNVVSWVPALCTQYMLLFKIILIHPFYAAWISLMLMVPVLQFNGYSHVLDIPECVAITKFRTGHGCIFMDVLVTINKTEVSCCDAADPILGMHLIVQIIAIYIACIAIMIIATVVYFKGDIKKEEIEEKDIESIESPLLKKN
jgi:hypothetical protein